MTTQDSGSDQPAEVDTSAPLIPKIPPPSPGKPTSDDPTGQKTSTGQEAAKEGAPRKRRRRRGRGGGGGGGGQNRSGGGGQNGQDRSRGDKGGESGRQGSKGGSSRAPKKKAPTHDPVEAVLSDDDGPVQLDEKTLRQRSGRQRKGKAVGRYQMNVHVDDDGHTHIAILEGRRLIEYYMARPADDVSQIHGNIYLGRVENVLPGMEAAFVDIATPKNAVLYRNDVVVDAESSESSSTKGSDKSSGKSKKASGKSNKSGKSSGRSSNNARIEDMLSARQMVLCQVTKNPIAHKGARLTQEVSLPGRFVVLVPNSSTFGISKRLPDAERKRLRQVLDRAKPKQHGVIVRTAAENVTAEEIERDVGRLLKQWEQIEHLRAGVNRPTLLYREPDMAVRVIREEFNTEYRAIVLDDRALHDDVRDYVSAVNPALADRVSFYDRSTESLPMFERFQIIEQLKKALDRKVWLPSGGSLIIEHTEALTVIDVNTGRNVGSSSLEETVFKNNLEAAVEIARQLRLRDIGGIIVIDFVDMEVKSNRDELVKVFRDALARDKTRTQVFNVSDLGLVEMTRKRIGEGLLESFSDPCPDCDGRGIRLALDLDGFA